MKNILLVVVLALVYINGKAQEKATPEKVDGVEIVVMSTLNEGYISTESIRVPNRILKESQSLNDRIQWVIQQSDVVGLLVTRDGVNFQVVREWESKANTEMMTTALFSKPVFFYAEPIKSYRVIKEQKLAVTDYSLTYVEISKNYLDLKQNIQYDALIIKDGLVKYIRF